MLCLGLVDHIGNWTKVEQIIEDAIKVSVQKQMYF